MDKLDWYISPTDKFHSGEIFSLLLEINPEKTCKDRVNRSTIALSDLYHHGARKIDIAWSICDYSRRNELNKSQFVIFLYLLKQARIMDFENATLPTGIMKDCLDADSIDSTATESADLDIDVLERELLMLKDELVTKRQMHASVKILMSDTQATLSDHKMIHEKIQSLSRTVLNPEILLDKEHKVRQLFDGLNADVELIDRIEMKLQE